MSIDDKSAVVPGVVLRATIAGEQRTCVAVEDSRGRVVFEMDGEVYRSLSAAHDAVYDGPSGRISGWRVWTIDGHDPAAAERVVQAKGRPTGVGPRRALDYYWPFRPMTAQPETGRRYFCDACMRPFELTAPPADDRPERCPLCETTVEELLAMLGAIAGSSDEEADDDE